MMIYKTIFVSLLIQFSCFGRYYNFVPDPKFFIPLLLSTRCLQQHVPDYYYVSNRPFPVHVPFIK